MSANTALKHGDPTTILRSLITPAVVVALLSLTEEELAVQFATVSEKYGEKGSFTQANLKMLLQRMSRAMLPKNLQTEVTLDLKGEIQNSQG